MNEPVKAPDAVYVRQRWVKQEMVEWVHESDKILREHGVVNGTRVYDRRHEARWRARRLIRLMVELRLHERWELKEHIEKRHDGYVWSVEYLGGKP